MEPYGRKPGRTAKYILARGVVRIRDTAREAEAAT